MALQDSHEDAITAVDTLVTDLQRKLRNIGDEITESDELSTNVTVEGLNLLERLGQRMAEDLETDRSRWTGWLRRREQDRERRQG